MALLKKIWPNAFKAKDLMGLIISLIVFGFMNFGCWLVGFILGFIPIVNLIAGPIWGIVVTIVGVYTGIGAIIAILHFLKIVK